MAKESEKHNHQGKAGNIPSLLLTNNEVINPLFCLFDTAGQLVGEVRKGAKKTKETKVEIHFDGSDDRNGSKKEMHPDKCKIQKCGQGKDTIDRKSFIDIESQQHKGQKHDELGQEIYTSDIQSHATSYPGTRDSHSRRSRRSECPPISMKQDYRKLHNDNQARKHEESLQRNDNEYSSSRRTNEHAKTRSKGTNNVSFVETQSAEQNRREELKREDDGQEITKLEYMQPSLDIDAANYRMTRRKSETPQSMQTCKREKSHKQKYDTTGFKDEQQKDNPDCSLKSFYRKEDSSIKSKNWRRFLQSNTPSNNEDLKVSPFLLTSSLNPHPKMSRRSSATPLYNIPTQLPTHSIEKQNNQLHVEIKQTRRQSVVSLFLQERGKTKSLNPLAIGM